MEKTALVVGATGLVGSELVKILLEAPEYDEVVVWVRKTTGISHVKLVEKIIEFDKLETVKVEGKVDHVFCCLGTTIKKAKTREAFAKVDLEYPLALGRWAKENCVSQFLVVSSIGADASSKVFYSKTKGQLEVGLKRLDLNGLQIFRPSLLLGERNEFRLGESTATVVSRYLPFFFWGPLKKYKPVQGKAVAYAMYRGALEDKKGSYTISSGEISVGLESKSI